MIEIKCKGCDRLLAKAVIMVAAIKCPRCKMIFEYKVYTNDLLFENARAIKNTESTETQEQ